MSDAAVREEVDEMLRAVFVLLNQHSHGDGEQGRLLAEAQQAVSQAVLYVRAIGAMQ